jgi:hypothetical protein
LTPVRSHVDNPKSSASAKHCHGAPKCHTRRNAVKRRSRASWCPNVQTKPDHTSLLFHINLLLLSHPDPSFVEGSTLSKCSRDGIDIREYGTAHPGGTEHIVDRSQASRATLSHPTPAPLASVDPHKWEAELGNAEISKRCVPRSPIQPLYLPIAGLFG